MQIYLAGALWVAGAAAVGALLAWAVRRFGLDEGRPDNNEATGQVFVIVSGLHAVIVGFVLISLFDAVSTTSDGLDAEAEGLVAASWAADSLPGQTGAEVRSLGDSYARNVVDYEWPQLRAGQDVTGPGWQQLDAIRGAIAASEPVGEWQEDRKTEAFSRLWEVYHERQARLAAVEDNQVAEVVWFVLIIGTVVTVLLPNLFGGTKLWPQVVLMSTLAGALTLLLFAIYQLQNPFNGTSAIQPDALEWAMGRLT
ncbi:hypothetical protein [Saccharopolyspora sp. SCSIO 74807]|uniref:bestrophin-like domain n=1 Tax=Saccharopolyspora sp. SCSIO 74807 TaxID=3118084 RepID=UPI0030CABD06